MSISEGITIIPEGICEGCSLLKEVTLPNNVIIIKSKAFSGCYSLESINIPETVEYIYQEAFKDCCFNEGINIYSKTPPFIYDNTFSDFSVPLKVPKGCKKEYQIAQVWKNFTNISELDNSKYLLTYMADGEEYKSYEIEAGETITPELAPTKENYTFSGWSEIPATMPAHDVTITGYFTLNPNATQSITMATSSGSPRTMKGYSSPYGLDFTDVEGVKAYTAVGFSEDHIVYLSRVKVVPPNTGIVLKTENPGITVDVPTTGIDVYLANLLLPAVSNVTVNPTEVIDGVEYRNLMVGLLNGTTTMGFVEFTSSVTRSNNCYLHVPLSFYNSTASARPMDGFEVVFDEGESTDIREIEEKTYHDDNVYDLQGRKVITPTKGLVIKNGKLVFVKP